MTNTTKTLLSLLSCLFLFFIANYTYGQAKQAEQFLSLVMEIESSADTQEPTVKVVSARTVQARLKTPTKSEKATEELEDKDLIVRFLSDKNKVQEEFIFKNPFLNVYEYPNEADQLERVKVREDKKAYFIRIPYQEGLATLQVSRKENAGEKLLLQKTIFKE